MNALSKVSLVGLILGSSIVNAEQFGPYNQKFTYNQQFSSANWYSSPLGQAAGMAGLQIIGGLVNAMSKPDPVVVVPSQSQYQQQQQPYIQQQATNNCRGQTLYDQSGNPRYVKVCE